VRGQVVGERIDVQPTEELVRRGGEGREAVTAVRQEVVRDDAVRRTVGQRLPADLDRAGHHLRARRGGRVPGVGDARDLEHLELRRVRTVHAGELLLQQG